MLLFSLYVYYSRQGQELDGQTHHTDKGYSGNHLLESSSSPALTRYLVSWDVSMGISLASWYFPAHRHDNMVRATHRLHMEQVEWRLSEVISFSLASLSVYKSNILPFPRAYAWHLSCADAHVPHIISSSCSCYIHTCICKL